MSLFVRMCREEWRLHAELFGGRRFAAFPMAVLALSAVGTWLLAATGTDPSTVVAGLHALLALFGLQVGTIGLVGRDALRDVLGDVTLLVFSARTLPLSWHRLLATFLAKDLVYYGAMVVFPAVLGFGAVAIAGGVAPATVGLAWVTVTLAFGLGVATSLALAGLVTRGPVPLFGVLVAVGAAVVVSGVDLVGLTPYALYETPSLATLAAALAPIAGLGALGLALFEPVEDGSDGRQRAAEGVVRSLSSAPLVRRPLLAVVRSSGSVGKVLFSMGVLFGATALVLQQVARATTITPASGLAFGTLLGLGGFTTYSWVTSFDDPREYLRYPVTYGEVFAGRLRAYLILAVGAGLAYLAVAAVWYPLAELAVGAVVLPMVATYVFGVAAYLTGLSPNELLFDTPLFLAFGAALAVPTVPLVVAALVHEVAPVVTTAGSLALAAVCAAIGLGLARRAGPRWDERLLA